MASVPFSAATFTDESVGCIMKPEFAPHLTRGQHICCSWLSKHCHCGARQKENFDVFLFFFGFLGWWVRNHWEWLRITETTIDTWNISVFVALQFRWIGPQSSMNMSHRYPPEYESPGLVPMESLKTDDHPIFNSLTKIVSGPQASLNPINSQMNYFLKYFFRGY